MTTYRIHLERDESGAWVARCPGLPGFHTYGRSLRQTRNRAREALSLWVDDADDADLEFRYHLPNGWREATSEYRSARTRAINAERKAQVLAAGVANYLTVIHGLSMRDAAELLGLSHQRVQQLTAEYDRDTAQRKVWREHIERFKRTESRTSSSRSQGS